MTPLFQVRKKMQKKEKIIGKVFVNRNEKIIPLHRRTIKTDFALQAKKIKFLVHEKFFPSEAVKMKA